MVEGRYDGWRGWRRAARWTAAVALGASLSAASPAAAEGSAAGGSRAVGSAAEGSWAWPLAGQPVVARGFDPPEVRYAAGHRGADLAGGEDAPVLAAGAGRVSYAGLLAGRGVVVVVHGELRTTYEPVVAAVAVGAVVAAGQQIGVLEGGHAGCPVAACLHWGLRRGDAYLDPVRLVDRGPVRLLPLTAAGRSTGAVPAPAGARAALVPAAAPEPPAPPLPPAPRDTDWSLRAADAPLGVGALVVLVAGLALLAAPRRPRDGPPDGPAAAGAAAARPEPPAEPLPALLRAPVDLQTERARRRTAS